MPIQTTCIGAYPKPDYIKNPNWCEAGTKSGEDQKTRVFTYPLSHSDSLTDEVYDRATREAIEDQVV